MLAQERGHGVDDPAAVALGFAEPDGREREAELDVPDDLRLQPVAIGLVEQPQVGDEPGRAEGLEGLGRCPEVGVGLGDLDAGRGQALDRGPADRAHLGLERCDPEVVAPGDPGRELGAEGGREERLTRGWERERVLRMRPGHRVEHQRGVRDVARHRALDRERVERLLGRPARNPPRRRPEADHRAERRRRAQAAAQVGAGREPRLRGRERDRRAARGAAARAARVPRVSGRAEHLVEGLRAGPELGRVRLGEHDGAALLEPLDQDVGALGHVVGVDRRPVGGADAGDVGQVLHGNWQSRQCQLAIRRLGMRQRPLRADGGKRVQRAVHRLDPAERRLHQLARRDASPERSAATAARAEREVRSSGTEHKVTGLSGHRA